MMAVEVTTGPTFSAGTHSLLFEGQYGFRTRSIPAYDVAPDGLRFLMVQESGLEE